MPIGPRLACVLCASFALVACSSSNSPGDSGSPNDSGSPGRDSGTSPDSGSPADSGSATDAGSDAGQPVSTLTILDPYTKALLSWAVGSNGNLGPSTVIAGANTQIGQLSRFNADGQGNIYMTTAQSIYVFTPGQNGNVTPTRTLQGSNVLSSPNSFLGVAADPAGQIYAVANDAAGTNASILVFAAGANGNVAPVRIISGANTTLATGLAVAYRSGSVYVISYTPSPLSTNVVVFDANANGNVAPQFSWTVSTQLECIQVAVDGPGNVYVACYPGFGPGTSAVYVFPPNTATPSRTLTGATTELTNASGVAVDQAGNMYVANADATTPSLLTFAPGANGNVAPIRNVSGPSTTLDTMGGSYPLLVVAY